MATLLDLPDEILRQILCYSSATDVARVSATCKKLYEISTTNEIWQRLCARDYDILPSDSNKLSCRSFYSKVLYRYGILIGLWNIQINPYGGLLQIKFDDNKLMGIEWRNPITLLENLRRKSLFSIELDEEDNLKIYCLVPSNKKHACTLEKVSEKSFFSKCSDPSDHINYKGKQQKFAEWFFEETLHNFTDLLLYNLPSMVMKYAKLTKYNNNYEFKRLYYPKEIPELPHALIQPGLFKCIYNMIEIELVMVTYPEKTMMDAIKVTGDIHVPIGQITFKVDLRYPVILTKEEQENIIIDDLLKQDQEIRTEPLDNLEPQTLIFPTDCRGLTDVIPTVCKSRFYGNGLLAQEGFKDSYYSPIHWIIFDDNTFGVLWLEMNFCCMFSRVLEKFD